MKTNRKLQTRRLALNFAEPVHPVPHDLGKMLLAKLRESLDATFAASGKSQ